jgi:pyroglutamyl-peptidase
MKTVLLTGFEPFGGDRRNPSGEVARQLDGAAIDRHIVVGAVLPCVFGRSARELRRLVRAHRPELVVCLGLAATRTEITPERVAINVDDARIADNAGARPVDRPVVRGGPAAYWSTLPVKAIVRALQGAGLPASVSQTAGTFVCNHVFYALMHELARGHPGVRGGFIHVPFAGARGRRNQAGLSVTQLRDGVAVALETALRVRRDARTTGGAVS